MRIPSLRRPEPDPPPRRRPFGKLIAPTAALAVGLLTYLGARRRRKT